MRDELREIKDVEIPTFKSEIVYRRKKKAVRRLQWILVFDPIESTKWCFHLSGKRSTPGKLGGILYSSEVQRFFAFVVIISTKVP